VIIARVVYVCSIVIYYSITNKFTLFIRLCLPSSVPSHLTHRLDIHSAVSQLLSIYHLFNDVAILYQNDCTLSNWCNQHHSFQFLFPSLSRFFQDQLFVVLQCCGAKLVPICDSAYVIPTINPKSTHTDLLMFFRSWYSCQSSHNGLVRQCIFQYWHILSINTSSLGLVLLISYPAYTLPAFWLVGAFGAVKKSWCSNHYLDILLACVARCVVLLLLVFVCLILRSDLA